MKPGYRLLTTSRFAVSLLVRSSLVLLVIGSAAASVLSKMLLACSSVSSCSLLPGVSPRTDGSSATSGLYSSTVLALEASTP